MGNALPPIRILLVEDDADTSLCLAKLLHIWGCETFTAEDGETALGEAAQFRPDLVIVDIGLPKLDGYEVARRLRRDEDLQRVPLVAMSGRARDELYARAEEAGFTSVLLKPVEPEQLFSWVEAVQRIRRLGGEQGIQRS